MEVTFMMAEIVIIKIMEKQKEQTNRQTKKTKNKELQTGEKDSNRLNNQTN